MAHCVRSWSSLRYQVTILLAVTLLATLPVHAQTLTTLYHFTAGADGSVPYDAPIMDPAGNLYGTTTQGGGPGGGNVFEIDSANNMTVLHGFAGGSDGGEPFAAVIRDSTGILYGTTYLGGSGNKGIVFKLDPVSKGLGVIHNFTGGTNDGAMPYASLYRDAAGSLYGTTRYGGSANAGVIFKITVGGTFSILHSFNGASDGANPYGGVIADAAGNFYGMTYGGGAGYGTVYKLDTNKNYTVLYTFTGGNDGAQPWANLLMDKSGNLYGTTQFGGTANSGVVFKIDTNKNYSVLHSMNPSSDGSEPVSTLVMDSTGTLYGTCLYGVPHVFYGTVFSIDTANNYVVRHSFTGGADEQGYPVGGVAIGPSGDLYGLNNGGDQGHGTVFKLAGTGIMSSPAKGSTIPPGSATFAWTAPVNGASSYQLWLGTTPGGLDIAYPGVTGTSVVVNGLPSNGQAVYATLWAQVNGSWAQQDTATYTAGNYAQIVSPAKGASIPGTVGTFTWSAESGATAYQMWLGTTPGAYDVGYAATSGLSGTIWNLPYGRPLYATLWGYAAGVWQMQDTAMYHVGGTGGATIMSPSKGSTLPGSTVQFSWSVLNGASYQIWVGSTPLGMDIATGGTYGSAITLGGLPTDGRQVYVTLWAYTGSTWVLEDTATYTAASQNQLIHARH